jgi:antitoxin (DNA-binding transcriptional repressor) of toxin-antitoxin stability system
MIRQTRTNVHTMSQQIDIIEAPRQWAELVQRALAGEDIVLARDNRPLLRLTPVKPPAATHGQRQPGSALAAGLVMAPDFDAPLDDFGSHMA